MTLSRVQKGHGKAIALKTNYDTKAALAVIEAVFNGTPVTKALDAPGMPSRTSFYRWLAADPELDKLFEAAREASAQAMEDKMLEMADRLVDTNDFTAVKVRQFEVAMNQYRWSASRRDPGKFAEKRDVNISIPVQINTSLDLGQGGVVPLGPQNIYHVEVPLSEPVDADYEPLLGEGVPEETVIGTPYKKPGPAPKPKPKAKIGRPKGGRYKGKTLQQTNATIATRRYYAEKKAKADAPPDE